MKIKTGDTVMVISGHSKGTIGEVTAVSPRSNRVIVEGVNMVKKALKPSQENPEGGIVETEAPIHVSNVMIYDTKAKQAGRVGYKGTGKDKVRYNKKTGNEIKEDKK